ncbi:MAG: DUF2807 domain-containing protein [Paludibacter sp.]|nr:DUF2807 domain-containing protein [Paludibacter sp.]
MNKKNLFKFVVSLLFSFSLAACVGMFGVTGTGDIITEIRPVSNFKSIDLLTSADVEIVKGDSFKVEVSDYENIIQYISLKVVARNLVISVSPITTLLVNSKAKIMITMPDSLSSVSNAGSGNVVLNSSFKDLELFINTGSGDIIASKDLNIKKMNASILGSGNITAKGTAETLTTLISGSGDIDFSNLISNTADCTTTGSGNTYVNVINTLKAKISGSGNIEYEGSPVITATTPGSGTLKPL